MNPTAVSARRQLRAVLWLSEVSIIAIAAVTSIQIATEHGGSIWACGPVAIIAALEAMRIPLSGWAAHLRPLARAGAFVVMGAISVLTFEGMSIAVERFMHQRVIEVEKARHKLDLAQHRADDEKDADDRYQKQFERLTTEAKARRDALVQLKAEQPNLVALPAMQTCKGVTKKGASYSYACPNPAAQTAANSNASAQKAHDAEVGKANDAVAEIEAEIKALPKPVHSQANGTAVIDAQRALEEAASDSTMYRTAAAWFSTPVKDLTAEQFERFKRYAVFGVAGAAATATMLVSFLSQAVPRDRQGSKLIRAIRAYLARKRKDVVRTVEKIVEKPVFKTVEVPKVVEVIKTVTKHIHVPVDMNTHRIVNRDGSLSDEVSPLQVVK
jgi:hypothetical protein